MLRIRDQAFPCGFLPVLHTDKSCNPLRRRKFSAIKMSSAKHFKEFIRVIFRTTKILERYTGMWADVPLVIMKRRTKKPACVWMIPEDNCITALSQVCNLPDYDRIHVLAMPKFIPGICGLF